MPASVNENPQNPFKDLFNAFGQQVGAFNWSNVVDHQVLEGDYYAFHAVWSGLFYKAAAENKQLYKLYTKPIPFNLEKDAKDPAGLQVQLMKSLLDDIANLGLRPFLEKLSAFSEERRNCLFVDDNTVLHVEATTNSRKEYHVSVALATMSSDIVTKAKSIINKYLTTSTEDPELFVVVDGDRGLELVSIGKPGCSLEEGNYSESVIKDFHYIVRQIAAEKPFGRLSIMHGPPGTGKTYLLRTLFDAVENEDIKFIYLPPEYLYKYNISAITKMLFEAAEDGDRLILLIEDADDCLVPRAKDNMVAISTLLNFADGFIGNMLDLRIVATTNANNFEIDKALRRPGRLCKIINVSHLSAGEANAVYRRLTGEQGIFKESKTLAEVYEAVAVSKGEIEKQGVEEKAIGFQSVKDAKDAKDAKYEVLEEI